MQQLYKRKEGGVWWCSYYDSNRKRIQKSTRCLDKRAAMLVVQQWEREAHDPRREAEDNTPLVSDALQYFIDQGCPQVADATLSMYVQKAGHLKRLLGDRRLSEFSTTTTMQGYIADRLNEGAARGTIYKEMVTMRQTLHAAKEAKRIAFDPRVAFPRFRVGYVPKERWLPPEEAIALLEAFHRSPHRQFWVVVALYTGGRSSEVAGIRWEDVNLKTGSLVINGTKTAAARREVPLQPVLAAVLETERKRYEADNVKPKGPIVGDWQNVRHDLNHACDRAGIAHCSPNDLRRTFATWLANQGVPENVVARLLGHGSSLMVRKVYARIEQGTMRQGLAKLSGTCLTGVTDPGPLEASPSLVTRESLGKLADILVNPVLGVRIELTTRGFSVPVSDYKYKQIRCLRRSHKLRITGATSVG